MKRRLIESKWYNELYTPREAIYPILPFLDKSMTYWEPTDFGESQIVKVMKEHGFKIIGTNIKDYDFFFHEPEFEYDAIITNPPYSLKDEFIERCYFLRKKFALLLPITALEGKKRTGMYNQFGIELLVLDKRINFMKSQGKKSNWFNTSWFAHGILPQPLMFGNVIEAPYQEKGKLEQ